MDERVTTRAEFDEVVRRLATALGEVVWAQVVEQGKTAEADGWLREQGGAMLRGVLGAAWTARSERLGVSGRCACGGGVGFRQHQHWAVHTILPGRDVAARGRGCVGSEGGVILGEGRGEEVKLGCI